MTPRYGSEEVDGSPLGKPLHFEFSNRTAPNRFLKGAMTERLSSWSAKDPSKRGVPSKELINVYKRWGEGGLGVLLSGNIMVNPVDLEAPGNAVIPLDAPYSGPRFDGFRDLATAAKAHGSLIVGQVSHAGRQVQSYLQPNPVSASDVHLDKEVLGMKFAKPHAASLEEIKEIIASFTHAAEFLHKAGFDGIQLHGAHGYLLAQFLSKTTNKRTDSYGGSLQNRSRLIAEIGRSIREKIPASQGFILSIKINSVEFQEGGFSPEECRDLCKALEEAQFDFVELSGGTYEELAFTHKKDSTKKREAFFLDFAEQITPGLSQTKVYVTGGFKSVTAMVKALDSIDGVGLARPVCQEPHLARDIIEGKIKTGAIVQKLPEGEFGISNVAAGTQIRQMGKDEYPIDLSSEENVNAFFSSVQKWMAGLKEDEEKFGFADIEGIAAIPYAAAA
ncbi:putative nadh oxidase [Phaeomoniella chlamydospora]|uniref:Putative nadh oxidase n=1 Tax=Phaeomoniella chlamydospora TaxID=158046 RepID=A0A0G2ESC3_PHACM|nr:putative nadh oxidase [Phaeomoniella chlamydospora]